MLLSLPLRAQTVPASAKAADSGATVILEPFQVKGSSNTGYGAQEASSSSRLNMAYVDIPQAVSVVTAEFLQDAHITESHDFVKFVNNVYPRATAHQPELFFIHGLQVTKSWVDGFVSTLPVNRDSALYDRIDYVKGPASAAMGRGDAGGMVNFVPKRPTGAEMSAATLTFGDHQMYRAEADHSGRITSDGKVAYRIPLYYEQQNNPVGGDLLHIKKYGIGPSVSWKISKDTDLYVSTGAWIYNGPGVIAERDWSNPNIYRALVSLGQIPATNPNLWNPISNPRNPDGKGDAYIPDDRIFGFPGPGRQNSVVEASATLVHKFADWLSYRQGVRVDSMHEHMRRYGLNVAVPRSPVDPTDFLVGITQQQTLISSNSVRAQGDLLASHDFESTASKEFSSSQQLLLGYDLYSNSSANYSAQIGGLAQSLYHPNYSVPLSATTGLPLANYDADTYVPFAANTARNQNHGNGLGYYFQYSGWFFNRRVNLMYGVREDRTASTQYNLRTNPTTVIQTGTVSTTVPRYSITYKPYSNLSLYYLHSEQADPPATSAEYSNFTTSGGGTAPPPGDPIYNRTITAQTKARYDEFGAKTQLFDKAITASIAFFQSYRSGFILNQQLNQVGANGIGSVLFNKFYVVNGEVTQGVEAEMSGRPLPRLTMTAGFAFQSGQKPAPGSAPTVYGQAGNGQLMPNESMINSMMFYGKYDFRDEHKDGFEVTAGGKFFFKGWVVSPGTYLTFNQNQYLIDLGGSYYFKHGRYFVNASLNNATNQLVYMSPNSQWGLRRMIMSIGTRF